MHVVTRGKSVVQKLSWVFPLSLSQWSNEDLPDLYWIVRCSWKGCTMEVWKAHDDMTIINIIWIVYTFSFHSVYWSLWCFNITEKVRIIAFSSVRQCVPRIYLPDLFTDLTPPPPPSTAEEHCIMSACTQSHIYHTNSKCVWFLKSIMYFDQLAIDNK